MKLNKYFNLSFFTLLVLSLIISPFLGLFSQDFDPDFNRANVISNFQMFDYNSMTESQIQAFLVEKDSYLANYKTLGWPINCDTKTGSDKSNCQVMKNMKASKIIYSAAQRYKVNPKYILVMLQKEQSLIGLKNPKQKRLDWACGYAVCDTCKLNDPAIQKYKGFGKQVDNGTGIMRWYSDNSSYEFVKSSGRSYPIDRQNIKFKNQATANLYTYTPHIAGNYTFWRVWQRYFGDPTSSQRDKAASISTDYMLQVINSSDDKVNLNEGEKKVIWVEYLNMGTKTWTNADLQSLYLIDAKYKSSIPLISKTSKFNIEEGMKKDVKVYSQRKEVKPGEVLRISIPLEQKLEKTESGSYILIYEGKGWFAGSELNYDLKRIFRYDGEYLEGLPKNAEADEKNTFIIKYKNNGLMTWYKNDVKLKWISSGYTNHALMNEKYVEPGQTASFTFSSQVKDVGAHEYDLSLWKVINSAKMNRFPIGDKKINVNMTVSYAAKLMYDNVPEEMKAGEKKFVKIKVRNAGTENWDENLVLRSYSKIAPFSASYFRHEDWLSGMAIMKLNKVVKPGHVYTFKFYIKAPKANYSYKQYYQLEWGPQFKEIYIDKDLSKMFETKIVK